MGRVLFFGSWFLMAACGSSGHSVPEIGPAEATPGPNAPDAAIPSTSGPGSVTGVAAKPGCEGSPRDAAEVVRDECGVFVAPAGKGVGSRLSPLGNIGDAIAAARAQKKYTVFACAGTYVEDLVIGAGDSVRIFGGLSCDKWTYGQQFLATIAAKKPAGARIEGSQVLLEDLAFQTPDASAPGDSSIGLSAKQATIGARRIKVTVGKGAPGKAGANLVNNHFGGNLGGERATKTCQCPAFGTSIGGGAGAGTDGAGGEGDSDPRTRYRINGPQGTYIDALGGGKGGAVNCGPGGDGHPGRDATGGAAGVPAYLSKEGWIGGQTAAPGGTANPGSGGGGSGRSLGFDPNTGRPPPSAGGACGGCGGGGGNGGGGGGSSIGVISIDSTFKMDGVSITTGDGASGGAGHAGQPGQNGGLGPFECGKGGDGGPGGQGGGGGGGAGGHSLGIAFLGPVPTFDGAPIAEGLSPSGIRVGKPGTGGRGGNDGAIFSGEAGLGGVASAVKRF